MSKRLLTVVACGFLAACTSGDVTVPESVGVTEVPYTGTTSSFGGAPLPEGVQVAPAGVTTRWRRRGSAARSIPTR